MTFAVGGCFTSRYKSTDANTVDTNSTVIFDAAYTYQVQDDASLAIEVSNVSDSRSVTYGGFGADFYDP